MKNLSGLNFNFERRKVKCEERKQKPQTEFSDQLAADAAVCDVKQTKNKGAGDVIAHVLLPPRHTAVWFSDRAEQGDSDRLQRHRSTCE